MSSLWTPSGEREPQPEPVSTPAASDQQQSPTTEEQQLLEEAQHLRAELTATPVIDIIANHAIGLWQLAVLHLGLEPGATPNLEEAQLAIDAMAAVVEGLGPRLGAHEGPLRDALAQLRLAYVQVSGPREGDNAL